MYNVPSSANTIIPPLFFSEQNAICALDTGDSLHEFNTNTLRYSSQYFAVQEVNKLFVCIFKIDKCGTFVGAVSIKAGRSFEVCGNYLLLEKKSTWEVICLDNLGNFDTQQIIDTDLQ